MLVALLALSGVASSLPEARQASLAVAVRATVLRPFLELQNAFVERARLEDRYARLRAERDSLLRLAAASGPQTDDVATLRRLLRLPSLVSGNFVAADLLPGRPRVGDSDVFVLRGRGLEGLESPAGVINGEGLVGVVRGAVTGGARGEFWTHPDFRASVVALGSGVTGIVRPIRLESGQPAMLLEGAPYQQEIAPGTELLTTGLAGVHAPGIRVGTVREESGEESGWMRRYYVEPAVRPENAHAVLVWQRPPLASDPPDPQAGRPESVAPGTIAPDSASSEAVTPDSVAPEAVSADSAISSTRREP